MWQNGTKEDRNMYGKTLQIEDRWLTVAELAAELKISQSTIRRRIKDGSIKALKLFGIVRVPVSQFYETN